MQGITRKILKNHILCRLVPRKCGKRVEIFCRDREPVTDTCKTRAGLSLQRKNRKPQCGNHIQRRKGTTWHDKNGGSKRDREKERLSLLLTRGRVGEAKRAEAFLRPARQVSPRSMVTMSGEVCHNPIDVR